MTESSDLRMARIPLNHGAGHMPVLGFGTLIPDAALTITATRDALEAGFRHFDCAERYGNEPEDLLLPIGFRREVQSESFGQIITKIGENTTCHLQSVMPNPVQSVRARTHELLSFTEVLMIRRFLAVAFFVVSTVSSQTPPSLPSSFQARTIHNPEGADIFVRWGGSGPVVVLIHGYAENSDSWAPETTALDDL